MMRKNELKLPNCKYRGIEHFQKLSKNFKMKTLYLLQMSVQSPTKNFDDFDILLNDLNVSFDTLAITESRTKKDLSSPINL